MNSISQLKARLAKVRELERRATTPGEKSAARAAIERIEHTLKIALASKTGAASTNTAGAREDSPRPKTSKPPKPPKPPKARNPKSRARKKQAKAAASRAANSTPYGRTAQQAGSYTPFSVLADLLEAAFGVKFKF